jgi:hypothetical protein
VVVPYLSLRNLIVHKYLGDKRANWMTNLQEYDLDIGPTDIFKGQGLYKLEDKSIGSKLIRVGYYHPTLFGDAHAYARKFQECQKEDGRENNHAFPLRHVSIEYPFQQ